MGDPNITRHTPAIAGEFDAREWAGVEVMRFDGQAVTVREDAGVYSDVIAFLNGYGSTPSSDLGSLIQTSIRAGLNDQQVTASVTINNDDKVVIWINGSPPWRLLGASDNQALGYPAEGLAAYSASHTAGEPFQRGVIAMSSGLRFDFDGVGEVVAPNVDTLTPCQSVTTMIRQRGADASDPEADLSGHTFEDRFLPGALNNFVRARVEPGGHVSISWQGGAADLQITDAAFWQRLGGSGLESPVNIGGATHQITTANPSPCFLALARGVAEMRRTTETRDRGDIMADGSVVSSGLSPLQGWRLALRINGPAFGYHASQEGHLRRWWAFARRSLTFFPQWGDLDRPGAGSVETRRHRDLISAGTSLDDQFYTVEADQMSSHYGRRKGGRLLLRRHPKDGQRKTEDYSGQELDTVQDIELKLLDDPTR